MLYVEEQSSVCLSAKIKVYIKPDHCGSGSSSPYKIRCNNEKLYFPIRKNLPVLPISILYLPARNRPFVYGIRGIAGQHGIPDGVDLAHLSVQGDFIGEDIDRRRSPCSYD